MERIFVGTSVIICCYFAFFLPIFEYCFLVCASAAECHHELLECLIYSVARLCPDQSFLSCVINVMLLGWVCCTRLIQTLITVCSTSFHLLLLEFEFLSCSCGPVAAAYPVEFEVSRCTMSQFARYILPAQVGIWNGMTVFDARLMDEFKGAVNCRLLPWVVFFSFPCAGAYGVAKATYKQFYFSLFGLCCWF